MLVIFFLLKPVNINSQRKYEIRFIFLAVIVNNCYNGSQVLIKCKFTPVETFELT